MEKFNQSKYIQEYNKTHYKRFLVDLPIDYHEKLERYLKKNKLTKAMFLKNIIDKLKDS